MDLFFQSLETREQILFQLVQIVVGVSQQGVAFFPFSLQLLDVDDVGQIERQGRALREAGRVGGRGALGSTAIAEALNLGA